MTIREELNQALKTAMKEKNDVTKRTVRSVISNIKNQEIDKQKVLIDEEIVAVLYKELKIREEAIDGAKKNDREDLIEEANQEIAVLKNFLPEEMPEEDIKKIIEAAIQNTGAASMADMGKVMKTVLPEIAGKAPNNLVSKIVKDLLSK